MAGKFEMYKDARGKFRFRLKAGNGEIVAASQAYDSKAACLGGIESIRSNAAAASLVDISDAASASMPAAAAKTKAKAKAKK